MTRETGTQSYMDVVIPSDLHKKIEEGESYVRV